MSEKITAENLEQIIQKNRVIKEEVEHCVTVVHTIFNRMKVSSPPQLAIQLLRTYGLIQMPIENSYLNGAIYVRNEKKIPFINTALPRVNQYFTAWHELYHIIFDTVSFDHVIESDTTLEERKAEFFASKMLLGNLMPYFFELPQNMSFQSKVYNCMAVFQTPYKAVLIALYEIAVQCNDTELITLIKKSFDITPFDMIEKFRELGLDDTLVLPSFVVDVSSLQSKIQESIQERPELSYHKENEVFLKNICNEVKLIIGDSYA